MGTPGLEEPGGCKAGGGTGRAGEGTPRLGGPQKLLQVGNVVH